jgi:hypothetical protein
MLRHHQSRGFASLGGGEVRALIAERLAALGAKKSRGVRADARATRARLPLITDGLQSDVATAAPSPRVFHP